MKETVRYIIEGVVLMMLCVFVLCAFPSCRSQKVVTVTEYRDRVQRDTLLRVDSVYVAHYLTQKGDTIWRTDTIYQFRVIHDTRDVYVHDSIPYEVEVPKEVRVRNGYDKFTARGFWLLVALLLMYVAWRLVRAYYLRR